MKEETFNPHRVQHYQDYLQRALPKKVLVKYRRAYIRNMSYSLQYMEYIIHTLNTLQSHYPVISQLRKSFIISGCGVIESILCLLLEGKSSKTSFFEMSNDAKRMKLLGDSSNVYLKLDHLRNLRNRVHINSVKHDRDNDYWTFEDKDSELMKEVLCSILKSDIFAPHPNYNNLFNWL